MKKSDKNNALMRYLGLGTQWMVLLLLAVWGGMKADDTLQWRFPLFTVLLPLVALIYSLWKLIQEFSNPKS